MHLDSAKSNTKDLRMNFLIVSKFNLEFKLKIKKMHYI